MSFRIAFPALPYSCRAYSTTLGLVLCLSAFASSTLEAQTVNLTYQDRTNSRPVDSSNSFLPNGCLVKIGTFPDTFDFVANASNLTALNAAFTVFDTSQIITETTRSGVINDSAIVSPTPIANKRIYYWVFNGATENTATQHGIFTNPSSEWLGGDGSPIRSSNSLSLGTPGLVAKVGSTVINPNIASNIVTTGKLTAITPAASYSTWASSYFNSTQLANAAISGDDASPAGDGVSNLLKYAFGLSPLSPIPGSARPSHAVVPDTGSNYVGITFRRNRSAPDLTFEVQFSSANGSWPSGASASQTVSTVDIGDGSDLVTVRDTTPFTAGQPARLARVKVTRN